MGNLWSCEDEDADPPKVVARADYDASLKKHLQKHSTPAMMTFCATRFLVRAHAAHQHVEERKARPGGCTSFLPKRVSATQLEAEQSELLRNMSREQRIGEGKKLLQLRCEQIKVRQVEMADDGNCQFRALAHELYGDQEHHRLVRSAVMQHMKANSTDFAVFVGDDNDWNTYLSKMGMNGCWGDELTLRAASDAYSCVVHIVSSEHENWLLHYGADGAPAGARECFLTYVSPIHYNVVAMIE